MKSRTKPPQKPPPLRFALSVDETSIALGVSRSFVYTLMRRGALSFFKVGADRRIPIAAIEKLAAGEQR